MTIEEKIDKYLNEKKKFKKGETINIPSGFGGKGKFIGYDKDGDIIVMIDGKEEHVFTKKEINKLN